MTTNMNRLYPPDQRAVPPELKIKPMLHDQGLVLNDQNVRFYQTAPQTDKIRPTETMDFRLAPGPLFLDTSSITLHFTAVTQNATQFATAYQKQTNQALRTWPRTTSTGPQKPTDANFATNGYDNIQVATLIASGHDCFEEIRVGINGGQEIDALTNYPVLRGMMERCAWGDAHINSFDSIASYGNLRFSSRDWRTWLSASGSAQPPNRRAGERQGWQPVVLDGALPQNQTLSLGQLKYASQVLAQIHPANEVVERKYSLKFDIGIFPQQRMLYGPAIGTLDLRFLLAKRMDPMSAVALRKTRVSGTVAVGTGSSDAVEFCQLPSDLAAGFDWYIKGAYITARLLELAPSYVESYMKQLNSKQGITWDFDTFEVRQLPLNFSANNRINYRAEVALTSCNAVFAFTQNRAWKELATEAVTAAPNPNNYIRDQAHSEDVTLVGPAGRAIHPRRSACFPYFNVNRYAWKFNGMKIHSHDVPTHPAKGDEPADVTQALQELQKAVGLFHSNPQDVQPPINTITYHQRSLAGNPAFIIGQNLTSSSARSGKAIVYTELELEFGDELSNPAQTGRPETNFMQDVERQFDNLYLVFNHDKQMKLHGTSTNVGVFV